MAYELLDRRCDQSHGHMPLLSSNAGKVATYPRPDSDDHEVNTLEPGALILSPWPRPTHLLPGEPRQRGGRRGNFAGPRRWLRTFEDETAEFKAEFSKLRAQSLK